MDDVLIDDWVKDRNLGIEPGGLWITHKSADDMAAKLTGMDL
jgi:hypothetical protein